MVTLSSGWTPDEWTKDESTYTTEYGRWNDKVMNNPVLRQIIDIRAAAIIKSYAIKGSNKEVLEKLLNEMRGRGCESFKMIMQNMYRVAYVAGDAYAEIIFDEDDKPVDLEILPSDNIRQVIKKGKIIRFEEINGTAKWEPYKIFHIKYKPRGAMTHGMSAVETMNNILIEYEQMIQLGGEMYRKMSKPREIIPVNTDNPTKLQIVRDAIKAAGDDWSGIVVLPASLIDAANMQQIILNPSLKPGEWLDKLKAEIFQGTATSEIILGGTGYSTGTEDALMKIAGFTGSIRDDQELFEESFRIQFIAQVFPDTDAQPTIEFSYALEQQDEKYNRNLQSIPIFANLLQAIDPSTGQPLIKPESIFELIKETLEDMGRTE